jgi:hypothetical protein
MWSANWSNHVVPQSSQRNAPGRSARLAGSRRSNPLMSTLALLELLNEARPHQNVTISASFGVVGMTGGQLTRPFRANGVNAGPKRSSRCASGSAGGGTSSSQRRDSRPTPHASAAKKAR